MNQTVLITGGAGFIGSHLADELLRAGYHVRVLDNLSPQVHGENASRPDYLDPRIELLVGDVRDAQAVRNAARRVDAIVHLAATVGVGQSMYQIERYMSVNNVGTAVLLEEVSERPVGRLIVASSMSVYGEGLCRDIDGRTYPAAQRTLADLRAGRWEALDEHGRPLVPLPTPESKPPELSSIYALSKYDQERMSLIVGRARGIPTAALRFFNVYGPRQALSNPYTGVLAIFAARYLNNRPPLIFEDGLQRRDFVSVHDVARAVRRALEVPEAANQVFNIGSGRSYTVLEVAERLAQALDKPGLPPEVTGRYRMGDIRHCFADIGRAEQVLGFEPRVNLEEGLRELTDWLRDQVTCDAADTAHAELAARGLTV